jgi:hypothetical protein
VPLVVAVVVLMVLLLLLLMVLGRRTDYLAIVLAHGWLLMLMMHVQMGWRWRRRRLLPIVSRVVSHPHRLVVVLWWRRVHLRWRRGRGPTEHLALPVPRRRMG